MRLTFATAEVNLIFRLLNNVIYDLGSSVFFNIGQLSIQESTYITAKNSFYMGFSKNFFLKKAYIIEILVILSFKYFFGINEDCTYAVILRNHI